MLALALSACNSGVESSEMTTIPLGIVSPLSGDAAIYGEEMQNIFEYALPALNEAAAANGYQFELVYEDGQCDGALASTAAQKLADFDGVEFMIGGVCSSESLGLAPLLEENGMLSLSATSSSPELRGASDYLFSLSYSDDGVGMEIARQLSEFDTIAILSEQNDYTLAMLEVVQSHLGENTEILLLEEYVKGETNFRNSLEKIQAAGAEAIFLNPNIGTAPVAIATQMEEIGGWDEVLISQFAFGTEVPAMDLDVTDGLIVVDAPRVDSEDFLAMVAEVTETQGAVDAIGNYYVASTYDALMILTDLIMEHDADVDAVRNALATESFDGYLGSGLSFDGETFVQGVGTANFEIRDGELLNL